MLQLERRSARAACTAALNQLHALVVTAEPALRSRLEGLRGERLAAQAARLRSPTDTVAVSALRRIARRALALQGEIAEIDQQLERIVRELAAPLLEQRGVGPVLASQLIVSSGDPRRMRSEAAFAALAGTSPVDASSGKQQRHRLNRGGDRQLNKTLHLIALNRSRSHPTSRAYYQRLLNDGKTKREALRCLKRALARHFYRQLSTLETLQTAP